MPSSGRPDDIANKEIELIQHFKQTISSPSRCVSKIAIVSGIHLVYKQYWIHNT
jgi:hypothetical protein